MTRERLQKYIANCGYCSRRKAELLIEHGLVEVNGKRIEHLGSKVLPGKDVVRINQETIEPLAARTILLNKPAGFITSTHDTHERLTVMDLLPRTVLAEGVLPAGRLDLETEGLLILTNQGELQHRITHPRYSCEKEYRARLNRLPTEGELVKLRAGIFLEDLGKKTKEAVVEITSEAPPMVRVVIQEGMKRQVRRLFEAVRIAVVHLERLRVGDVKLGDLPRGAWRDLTPDEVAGLVREEDPESPAGQ